MRSKGLKLSIGKPSPQGKSVLTSSEERQAFTKIPRNEVDGDGCNSNRHRPKQVKRIIFHLDSMNSEWVRGKLASIKVAQALAYSLISH